MSRLVSLKLSNHKTSANILLPLNQSNNSLKSQLPTIQILSFTMIHWKNEMRKFKISRKNLLETKIINKSNTLVHLTKLWVKNTRSLSREETSQELSQEMQILHSKKINQLPKQTSSSQKNKSKSTKTSTSTTKTIIKKDPQLICSKK